MVPKRFVPVGAVGNQPGIEHTLPIVRSIKAAIEVEIGASQVHTDLLSHLLQRVQAFREQAHVRLMHGSHGEGSQAIALVVRDGDAFLALLVCVPRVPDAIPPCFATVLVPSPWSPGRSRCGAAARCRTLARNACHRAPSSAHLAKARETVVEWMAGVPWVSVGTGQPFHGIPV